MCSCAFMCSTYCYCMFFFSFFHRYVSSFASKPIVPPGSRINEAEVAANSSISRLQEQCFTVACPGSHIRRWQAKQFHCPLAFASPPQISARPRLGRQTLGLGISSCSLGEYSRMYPCQRLSVLFARALWTWFKLPLSLSLSLSLSALLLHNIHNVS